MLQLNEVKSKKKKVKKKTKKQKRGSKQARAGKKLIDASVFGSVRCFAKSPFSRNAYGHADGRNDSHIKIGGASKNKGTNQRGGTCMTQRVLEKYN